MRLLSIAAILGSLAACNQHDETHKTSSVTKTAAAGDKGSGAAVTGAPEQQQAVAKKPLDSKPLPQLEPDKGGASGKVQWAIGWGGRETDAARSIALDAKGNIYVVGYFDAFTTIGGTKYVAAQPDVDPAAKKTPKPTSDAYLVKLTPDGKVAWSRTWGAKRDDDAKGVAVRGDTVIVVGNFLDELKLGEITKKSFGSDDIFAATFTTGGDVQWIWTAGGIDTDGANSVAATPDGGWVIGGSFSGKASFFDTKLVAQGGTDAFLIKLTAGGTMEWLKQFGGTQNDTIAHLAVDAQGSIYVQGLFKWKATWGGKEPFVAAGGSDDDIVLAKFDLNGDHVWSQRFGNPFVDIAGGLAVDAAGNVTMVGGFERQISFGDKDDHASSGDKDVFVARFTTAGKLVWAHTYGGDREDVANGVAVDGSGNVVVVGSFTNTVDFGKPLTSKNRNRDVFALKLDSKGNFVWVQQWGDKDHDQGRGVAIDDKGAALVTGFFRFTLDLVSPPVENARAEDDPIPKSDVFVVKLDR